MWSICQESDRKTFLLTHKILVFFLIWYNILLTDINYMIIVLTLHIKYIYHRQFLPFLLNYHHEFSQPITMIRIASLFRMGIFETRYYLQSASCMCVVLALGFFFFRKQGKTRLTSKNSFLSKYFDQKWTLDIKKVIFWCHLFKNTIYIKV